MDGAAKIAQEEQRIALLQAELQCVRKKQSVHPSSSWQGFNSLVADDDPLEQILISSPSYLAVDDDDAPKAAMVRPERLAVQARLLGWEVLNVQRLTPSAVNDQVSYEFRGQFHVAGRLIPAVFGMNLEIASSSTCPTTSPRVVDIHVVSMPDYEWLPSLIVLADDKSWHAWIQAINKYLQYERRRNAFIKAWQSRLPLFQVQYQQHQAIVTLPLRNHHDASSNVPCVSLIWSWSFETNTDALQWTEQLLKAMHLQDHELDRLVHVCGGSCEAAMELILPEMEVSPEQRNDEVQDERATAANDADTEASEDDMEPEYDGKMKGTKVVRQELSEYERLRLERIKRNEAFLEQLGLDKAIVPVHKRKSVTKRKSSSGCRDAGSATTMKRPRVTRRLKIAKQSSDRT